MSAATLIAMASALSTTSMDPSDPAFFKIIDAHVSGESLFSTASRTMSDKFTLEYHVSIPNYDVLLVFTPHEWLTTGSQRSYANFDDVRNRAICGVAIDDGEVRELLLPFMKAFSRRVSRGNPGQGHNFTDLTLKDIEFRGCWQLGCAYVQDQPVIETIQLISKPPSFTMNVFKQRGVADGGLIQLINHGDVHIPHIDGTLHSYQERLISCTPPTQVTVNGRMYLYHPLTSRIETMQEEINAHVKLLSVHRDLYYAMRILPLCGVVLDDDFQVVGLLKEWHSISEENYIGRVLAENEIPSEHLKYWLKQFETALDHIRTVGLVPEPHIWNVAVNDEGEVWVVSLCDGRVPIDEGVEAAEWTTRECPGLLRFLQRKRADRASTMDGMVLGASRVQEIEDKDDDDQDDPEKDDD